MSKKIIFKEGSRNTQENQSCFWAQERRKRHGFLVFIISAIDSSPPGILWPGEGDPYQNSNIEYIAIACEFSGIQQDFYS